MSTSTNFNEIMNSSDFNVLVEADDYDVLTTVNFNLYVDNKTILARIINLRHPELAVPRDYFYWITGEILWHHLNSYHIDKVLMTCTDPLYIVVLFGHTEIRTEGPAYFKITCHEYHLFIHHFCHRYRKEDLDLNLDWKIMGF